MTDEEKQQREDRRVLGRTRDQGQCSASVMRFEEKHALPLLWGDSAAQNVKARYCRYEYLRQSYDIYKPLNVVGKDRMVRWLKELKTARTARFWIDRDRASLGEEWLEHIKDRNSGNKSKAAPPIPIASPDNWKLKISRQALATEWTSEG